MSIKIATRLCLFGLTDICIYAVVDEADHIIQGPIPRIIRCQFFVDDVLVEEGSFNEIKTADEYTDVARKNTEIKLFYAPVAAQG